MDSENNAPDNDANKLFDEAQATNATENAPEIGETPAENAEAGVGEVNEEPKTEAVENAEAPVEGGEAPAFGGEVAPEEAAPVENAPATGEETPAAAEAAEDTPAATAAQPMMATAEKKKSKTPAILCGILVILLFAGVAFGAWWFNENKNNTQKNDTSETEKQDEISSYKMDGNGLSEFDLSLLKLDNKKTNSIYSPLSIKYALNMIADGSEGATKEEINDILGEYKAKKYLNSQNRSLANALFVRDSFYDKILPTYIEGLQNNYGADVISDSFANADKINQWISNQTLGIIKETLNDDDIREADYALVNALAIDMKWNYALQCAIGSTTETKDYDVSFAHEDYTDYVGCLAGDYRELMEFNGVEDVDSAKIGATINNYDIVATLGEEAIRDTIKQEYKKWYDDEKSYKPEGATAEISEAELDTFVKELDENYHTSDTSTDFYWNETDDAKVFAKDLKEYDGATLQYVGIMPKNSDLDSFISSASAGSISELIDGVKEIKNENFEDGSVIRLTGNIPFFKYQRDFDLTEELPKVGIETMFSDEADLSKMISEKDQKIDFMIHKADIDFSNDGIKAAAVTIGGGRGDVMPGFDYKFEVPVTEIDVTFDKPFFYIIRDKSSNEVWFVGSTRELEAEE